MDLLAFRKQDAVDLTQEEVAAATGVDQTTISRLETGATKNPRLDVVQKIQAWADKVARRRRLPKSKRLTWGSFQEDSAA
jgi:transcriptional regulator with XRE-family HTH domain